MVRGIHFLLTYACILKCDHCFLYCSPTSKGTMTLNQIRNVLEEARKLETIKEIYFEGGEPFLFYPLMVEGVRQARKMKFKAGIVSNAYWSTNIEDARLWLKPLSELGLSDLGLSEDDLHFGTDPGSPVKAALVAAKKLGIPAFSMCTAKPEIQETSGTGQEKGTLDGSGRTKMRGRAVEKFAEGLPLKDWNDFKECPYEDLVDPKRVHIDAYGNVQICQGISLGNCWKTPLSEIIKTYDAQKHPICGPLVRGGPVGLMKEQGLPLEDKYVDECHMCYCTRLALIDRFAVYLAPKQVYGLE